MSSKSSILVTQSSLAPLDEMHELLATCWENGILTNDGPLVQRLEREISGYLGIDRMVAVTNGTIALQIALRCLDVSEGEVITTPFSWIATCSAIRWENCKPVFVDVDPETFNIDPSKIEAAITRRTRAIMAVHVFSNPCDTKAIQDVADRHNLRVIYDGAHAFGVHHGGRSIFEYGDISTASFHATKLFNCGEGGACFSTDLAFDKRLRRLRLFGLDEAKNVVEDGCNGKMTEIHAALGLANLRYIRSVSEYRKVIFDCYQEELINVKFIKWQKFNPGSYNYCYMPVIFESESQLLQVLEVLGREKIYPRRYFYPSLNSIPILGSSEEMPISESLSKRILCLPSFTDLALDDVRKICCLIKSVLLT